MDIRMHMILRAAFIILFVFSTCVAGARIDSMDRGQFIVNVAPFALIDVNDGPSLRPGIAYKSTRHWGFCLDAAGYIYFPSDWTAKFDVKGYALMPSVKYYFKTQTGEKNQVLNRYFSLQYAYKNQAYAHYDSIEVTTAQHISKAAYMHQYCNSVTVCYGEQNCYRSGFTVDIFAGFGIRFISSTSNLTDTEQNSIIDYHDWTGDMTDIPNRSVGHWASPIVSAGIKIGHLLW